MRSRNEQEKAQRRESMLNAAQEAFASKGFENTSMDDIAEITGYSRSLLYVYFKDKKDIYRALRIRSAQALRQRMVNNVNLNDPGLTRIKQHGMAYFAFYREDKSHFDCLSVNISLNNQGSENLDFLHDDPESTQIEREIMELMVDSIETGIQDGSIDPNKVSNPWQTAMFFRGCLHGVIQLQDKDGAPILKATNQSGDDLVAYTIEMAASAFKPN